MSDSFYQGAVALVLGAALFVQLGFAVYYFRRRDWGQLRRLGLLFLGWLLATPILFLLGAGACPALTDRYLTALPVWSRTGMSNYIVPFPAEF